MIGVFFFLLGIIVGSFLNVCIYRIPLKRSIVSPPSSCPACGKPIRFYDNIPLLSYLLLLGRCRNCKNPITIRYPLVELITGLLSLSLFLRFGPTYPFLFYLYFTASLVVISFIDLQHQIIPDIISIPGIVVGFAASFFLPSHISWMDSLIGIIGGGGILFLIAVLFERLTGREGMGGGDIKLLAMIGAWVGWRNLPLILLVSSLAGILVGGGALFISRQGLRSRIPFGPFLALGALISFFFGPALLSWIYRVG